MNLKKIENKIIYIVLLISVILMFLGMHNSASNTIYGLDNNFGYTNSFFIYFYFFVIINIVMYSIFFDTDKKYYIKKIIKFYAIVFILTVIDIIFAKKRYLRIYTYLNYSDLNDEIIFSILFVAFLLLSSIFIINHINKYKSERGIKNFLKNMLLYSIKSSIPNILILLFGTRIEDLLAFVILELVFIVIFIIVFLIVYFISIINFYNLSIKKIACGGVLILILTPIFSFREELFMPIENIFAAFGNDSIYEWRKYIKSGEVTISSDKLKKKKIESEIDNYVMASSLKKAEIGTIVKFGKSFLKTNINSKIDNYYYVYDKNGDELTLLSLFITDRVDYKDLLINNGEYRYKTYLDTVFYENAFSKEEKKYIVEKVYEDGKTHKVYVPNYKYYLFNKYKNYESPIKLTYENLQVYNKYTKRMSNESHFGILLSETKLKKDNIRMAKYACYSTSNEVVHRSIFDFEVNDNSKPDLDCYLRPVITVNINR